MRPGGSAQLHHILQKHWAAARVQQQSKVLKGDSLLCVSERQFSLQQKTNRAASCFLPWSFAPCRVNWAGGAEPKKCTHWQHLYTGTVVTKQHYSYLSFCIHLFCWTFKNNLSLKSLPFFCNKTTRKNLLTGAFFKLKLESVKRLEQFWNLWALKPKSKPTFLNQDVWPRRSLWLKSK